MPRHQRAQIGQVGSGVCKNDVAFDGAGRQQLEGFPRGEQRERDADQRVVTVAAAYGERRDALTGRGCAGR
jgi:hypothetical protein